MILRPIVMSVNDCKSESKSDKVSASKSVGSKMVRDKNVKVKVANPQHLNRKVLKIVFETVEGDNESGSKRDG
jgi:hypothetical protein